MKKFPEDLPTMTLVPKKSACGVSHRLGMEDVMVFIP
jgi:hypothetical protein